MMRRHSAASTAAGLRAIANFDFGHPDMETEYLPRNHYTAYKAAEQGPVRVSKLPNGARIVTHDRQGAQMAIGAYVEAGAKFDPATAPGLNYVLRWALSGSNMENSLFQLDRNARAVGAAREHCEVRKRYVGIKFEAPAGPAWERLAWDLFTSISAPRFPEYDVERFRDTMDNLREEQRWNAPREYAVDQLETVAFYREPLGNPRMVPPEFNGSASHAALVKQWSALCTPSRVVIAGVNIEHDALVAAYENAPFGHSATAPHHQRSQLTLQSGNERAQYQEGSMKTEQENRGKAMGTKPDMDEEAIVALGFAAHGAEANIPGFATTLVARELAAISFGESLSINRDDPHHGVESFYRPFVDTGLFGATIRSAPGDSQPLVKETIKAIRGLDASDAALGVAKARAAARYFSENMEVSRDYLDWLATNLKGDTMHRLTADEIFGAINDVNGAAVKNVLESFKSTRPTLFATGEVVALPSLRQLGL